MSSPFRWLILISSCVAAAAQTEKAPPSEVAGIPVNYDESKVGTYTLPDPLVLADGKPVRDAKTWTEKRRPEIVRLFEENQYGRAPGRPAGMTFEAFDKGTPAFDGKAIRRQITVHFSSDKDGPKMDLLLYLPAHAQKPVPFLLNIELSPRTPTPWTIPEFASAKSGDPTRRRSPRIKAGSSERSTSCACSTRGSDSAPSTTAISTPISWAAYQTECARNI